METVTTVAFVIFAVSALISDARTQRLPNRLTMLGLVLALVLRAPAGVPAVLDGLGGAGIALGVSIPLFLMGAVGGGDGKLLMALGAFTGIHLLWPALLASMVLGGVLGVLSAVRRRVIIPVLLNTKDLGAYLLTAGRKGERVSLETPGAVKVPYGVAISLGFLAAWFLPLLDWI